MAQREWRAMAAAAIVCAAASPYAFAGEADDYPAKPVRLHSTHRAISCR